MERTARVIEGIIAIYVREFAPTNIIVEDESYDVLKTKQTLSACAYCNFQPWLQHIGVLPLAVGYFEIQGSWNAEI
jgi:hypothetical protein